MDTEGGAGRAMKIHARISAVKPAFTNFTCFQFSPTDVQEAVAITLI